MLAMLARVRKLSYSTRNFMRATTLKCSKLTFLWNSMRALCIAHRIPIYRYVFGSNSVSNPKRNETSNAKATKFWNEHAVNCFVLTPWVNYVCSLPENFRIMNVRAKQSMSHFILFSKKGRTLKFTLSGVKIFWFFVKLKKKIQLRRSLRSNDMRAKTEPKIIQFTTTLRLLHSERTAGLCSAHGSAYDYVTCQMCVRV